MTKLAQEPYQSPPKNDETKLKIKALLFLDTTFADKKGDEHVCVSRASPKKDGDGVWFKNFTTDARQWRKWDDETQDQAWYFCVSSINGELNEKGTMVGRGRANLKRYFCLVLDDIGTKVTPPPVEPSWKITTSMVDGHVNQQWGFFLDPGDDWGRYEALVEFCADKGWTDGGAGGSYRLMRVPGSCNMKPGRELYHSNVTAWGRDVWSLAELAVDLGCDFSQLKIKDVTVTTKEGGATAMGGIDPMLDWLLTNRHVVKDSGGEWVDIVCPWADQHTSGENTAGYSPLGRGSGQYVQTRAFKCLHEHCVDKKLGQFREWSVKLGAPVVSGFDPLPWLQSRFIYVSTGQMVYDLHQRKIGGIWEWILTDWTKDHPGKIVLPGHDRPILISNAFIEHSNTSKCVGTMYRPTSRVDDTGIVNAFEQSYVNTYVPPNWPETDAPPDIFLEHMNYLIQQDDQHEVFLNWLAYKIQNPLSRSYAVVMVAEDAYGTGRSWMKDMLSKVLQGHVNTTSLPALIGKGTSAEQTYNDWMACCQFLVIEEAKDTISRDDFYHSYETFKQMVDTRVAENIRINPKYGRTRRENIYFNALIFSNHADALALPEGDRRAYVLENPTKRLDYDYYERLSNALCTDEPARVYWWLMHRDVSKFDNVYPPMTEAKARMIESTRAPSDAIIEHILENHAPDLVTRSTLKTAIFLAACDLEMNHIMREPSGIVKILWRKMKTLRPDDAKHGARYMVKGNLQAEGGIRNQGEWLSADINRDDIAVEAEFEKAKKPKSIVHL